MRKKRGKGIVAAILAVCMACSTAPAMSAAIPKDEGVTIDDTEFQYSAGDANNGGWTAGGWGDATTTEHWANVPDAWAKIQFNGTDLEIYGKKAPNHRMFSVGIDGVTVECDAYDATATGNNQVLFSTQTSGFELEAGDHTATVTVLEKKNDAATQVLGMNLAYAKAYGGETPDMEAPEFPGYTDIDDSVTTTTGEPFKITYEPTENWHQESGYNQFFNGTDTYSDRNVDVSYQMEFTGTGVAIYASKNTAHANCDVYIDGKLVGTAEGNLASGATQHKQLIFEKKDLENSTHTLKVVPAEGYGDKAMQVDQIRVYHDQLAPTALNFNKTQVTMAPEAVSELVVTAVPWVASKDVVWKTSDDSVVTVENGVLTAKAVTERKQATVTAASALDNTVTASVTVTVDPARSVMNAYVGDEKLLDLGEDYEALKNGVDNTFAATAWRGDLINSKVVVTTEKTVHNVEVTASDFTTANGATLSKDQVDIKWLKEVSAQEGRNAAGSLKQYPDVIYQGGAKNIDAGDVQFAWVQIAVPEGTAAGTYTGILTVSADELKQPVELTYTIEVLDLVQPSVEEVDYEVQIWQHPFSVANYYLGLGEHVSVGGVCNETANDFYFTDAHLNLMRASMEEYAAMGGHDLVATICEEAWSHQSFYGDPSMVKWTKMNDGTWKFDYTWYDQWVKFAIDTGVIDPTQGIGQIKCYSMVLWSNFTYYTEDGRLVTADFSLGSQEWKNMWSAFLRDFVAHSQEKGWLGITYISMDERELSQLEPVVELIEEMEQELKVDIKISSAMNRESLSHMDFLNRIDDISINLDNTYPVETMRQVSQERREEGKTTTFYSCTGNYPTNFMTSDPGDNYWTAWYALTLGTDGFMRWAWDNYVYDMFGNATYRYWEPGDGWYVYPQERESVDVTTGLDKETGKPAAIYSTPRYEMFKQGLRDAAKAKYLLRNPAVSQEQKDALASVVEHLTMGQKGTYVGAAVPANEEQRMLTHSESARALTATNELARQLTASQTPAVNKDLLQATYDYAKQQSTEGVTETAAERFRAALEAAEAVLNDETATQESVDQVWRDLLKAIWGLGVAQGDMTDLDKLIATAEEMKDTQDRYVQSNWQQLLDALDNAWAVKRNENALEDEVKTAAQDLLNAILAQRFKANKENLELLIGQAEAKDLTGCTQASIAAFQAALATAKDVLADDTLSEDDQTVVDAAYTALWAAMDGLTAEGAGDTEEPSNTEQPGDTKEPGNTQKPENETPAQTGDNSQLAMYVCVLSIAAAGMTLLVVRKHKEE